jgi:hypothetical protein
MADISSALENMTLENAPPPPTQHHVLNLIYLAIRLLPDGTSLHLARPTDCAHREQPRLGTYHLSAENLSFFHRFAVKPLARYLPQFEDGLNLLTINVLAAAAGHSHLECVSYLDAYGEVQHIVCLTVTWNAQDKDADIVQYRYELSDADLRRTFSLNAAHNAYPWLDLLFNLVYRCSDRAYLHVQEQLLAHVPTYASQQEALWAAFWDTQPSESGRELFMSRLQCQLADGSGVALSDLDPENLAAHSQQPLRVLLACGHTQRFVYAHVRRMQDIACLEASCHKCGHPVLGPADMIALANRLSRIEREWFIWEEDYLVALDKPVSTAGWQIEASVHNVCQALEDTLNGFDVPSSATPTALSFVHLPETQAVLHVLQQELRGAGEVFRATPSGLLQDLETESKRALMWFIRSTDHDMTAFLPPGLLAFLGKWLRRTVNSLSGLRYVAADEVDDLSLQLGAVRVSDRESKSMKIRG